MLLAILTLIKLSIRRMRFIIVFLFLSYVHLADAQIDTNKHRLLWEITGNGLNYPSYIFGSMHSNDKRIFNFHDSIYVALDQAENIVLETDIFGIFDELDVRVGNVKLEYDKDGKPYSTSSNSTKTAYGDEDGRPQFLDAFLEQYCINSGKKLKTLESIEFQLGLIPSFADADWSKVKISSIVNDQEDMIESYIMGDIDQLLKIMESSLGFLPEYLDRLLNQRNITMTQSLDSILQIDSKVFCAVGAGHLGGKDGILSLLEKKGYQLRRVHVQYSDDVEAKERVNSFRKFNYVNDQYGFHAGFGCEPRKIVDPNAELKLIYQELGQGNTYVVEVYSKPDDKTDQEIAADFFPSPEESPFHKTVSDFGQDYFEGIADAYPEGIYWCRVLMNDQFVLVLKAYGGNKFMNSNRATKFFDQVWFSE